MMLSFGSRRLGVTIVHPSWPTQLDFERKSRSLSARTADNVIAIAMPKKRRSGFVAGSNR